jgi:hypothetical protein
VGRGKGLELVVVEGRVRSRPGCEHCSRYPTRALKSGLGGVGFEVLRVLGCMPGGRIAARWPSGGCGVGFGGGGGDLVTLFFVTASDKKNFPSPGSVGSHS